MTGSDAFIVGACMDVWRKFKEAGSLRSLKEGSRTVLAGVVLCDHSETPSKFQCISLGSGTKCLPQSQLPKEGDALHDTHAEILARRGAVRWLLGEYAQLQLAPCYSSEWLRQTSSGLVGLKPSVSMHMYVSSTPCGDASMLSLALEQDPLVAALKDSGDLPMPQPGTTLRGRNHYSAFGAMRTKPGRADSIPSISMSCSDKILKWCLLGIQGAVASLKFEPIYLSSIIIGDVPMESRDKASGECERAFSPHRHPEHPFDENWKFLLFFYHKISVRFTDVDFPAARGHYFCNGSIAWNAHGQLEVLVNGRLQGSSAKNKRGKLPSLSRAAFRNSYEQHGWTTGERTSYNTLKRSSCAYQTARDQLMAVGGTLEGWIVAQEDRII